MTVRIECLPSMYGYTHCAEEEDRYLDDFSEMLLLDDLSDERINRCTKLLAETLDIPVVFINLTNSQKSWSHRSSGARFTDKERDLCLEAQAISFDETFITTHPDSDPRFEHHPAVKSQSGVKFIAGAASFGINGNIIGTCCAIDFRRRHLTHRQVNFLNQTLQMIEREMQSQEIVAELRENIKNQASRNPVTELPNLSMFHANLDRCLHCEESKSRPYVVATIRMARYDMLENAIGRFGTAYLIGNAVERINNRIGSGILVGQIREDELVVACAYKTQHADHAELLETIRNCFKYPFSLGSESFFIAVEIGASRYPRDAENSAELVRKARIALRSTEAPDRSGYRLYKRSFAAQSDHAFRLESALTRGLSDGELFLVYQPIVSLSTGRITGAEALMRWTSQDLGAVPPGIFIPIAERIGIIGELGHYAASSVCEKLANWQSSGLKNLNVSFNLSGKQLHDPEFFERMVQLIDESNVDGSQLTLEITENSLIEDPFRVIEVMNGLRAKSVSFSIDDFGTGFSSLNYLRMMPLDILKIDRSFVANVPDNANSSSIAQSVIALGHSLSLKIVAEGVENFRQLEWLEEQQCDEVQGYVFSKPLGAEKFEELVRENPLFRLGDKKIQIA